VVTCPNCQAQVDFPSAPAAGATVQCPRCNHAIGLQASPPQGASSTSAAPPPAAPPQDLLKESAAAQSSGAPTAGAQTSRFRRLLNDIKGLDLRGEILPTGRGDLVAMFKDFVFVAVILLGTIPLLIISVTRTDAQLTLFALFFALVWGVVFKLFILQDEASWKWPIASLFFTGIVGLWALLFMYTFLLPEFYLDLADSGNLVVSLIGFVLQVGLWEESLKAVPVLALAFWLGRKLSPMHLLTVGVFSGLGFAAFENMDYANRAISQSYSLTRDFGISGLVEGVQAAMVTVLLRAVSLVFAHAVFAGIVAYFVAAAAARTHGRTALIMLGVGLAALLHGLYDWLAGLQTTAAALVIALCFVLFYSYVTRLRRVAQPGQGAVAADAAQPLV